MSDAAGVNGLINPALLESLVDAATAANDGDRDKARNTLTRALALLTAGHGQIDASPSDVLRGGLAPWQARRVAAYVRDNIGATVRASELSALVRLSYSHFNRAFKVSFCLLYTSPDERNRE